MLALTSNEAPFIHFILGRNCDGSASTRCNLRNLLLIDEKEGNNLRYEHRLLARHAIALPMYVEAPGVQVTTTIAFVSATTGVIYRVDTVTSRSNNNRMKVSNRNFKDLALIKLLQFEDLLASFLRVICSNAETSIYV